MTGEFSNRSAFASRERALEDSFFHNVDAGILRQMREQMQSEKNLDLLAEKSGIRDPELLQELLALGITAENLLVLWLVPLTQVAWADGGIDRAERKAVEAAMAEQGFGPDSVVYHVFEAWLDQPPSDNVIEAWREYSITLLQHTEAGHRERLKHELLERARDIAQAAGGVLNLGNVSRVEEAVIRQIEDVIGR